MLPTTQGASDKTLTHHIGYDLLGPVVQRWLLGLHQHMVYLDDGKTKFLFCARAGVRIQELYKIFCEGRPNPAVGEMFWVSRISSCKGCFASSEDLAAALIAREFQIETLSTLIQSVMRNKPDVLAGLNLEKSELQALGTRFPTWINGDTDEAKVMRDYLEACSASFKAHIGQLVGDNERVVLIDSGWQGSTQSLLKDSFPDLDWKGLYLGRILSKNHDPSIVDDVIGIVFQEDEYSPEVPESAFILHHHLIETMLEPNGPSVEEVVGGALDGIVQEQIAQNLNAGTDTEDDALYLHVQQYLKDHASLDEAEIFTRFVPAMKELARVIATPTRDEALATICKDRSADFGKTLHVPVLLPTDYPEYDSADERIANALWKTGQVALEESSPAAAQAKQEAVLGISGGAAYFDPVMDADQTASTAASAKLPEKPIVAVITRTKNRPVLLKRAAKSVANQTYDGYIWVVVNDGGDPEEVKQVIAQSGADMRRVRLVSNAESQGMEAASNIGIKNCDSDYIVIHDDDDSWDPAFLEKTVDFLESSAGARYGGVVTGTTYVEEEISGDEVIIHETRPYNKWLRSIQLTEIAVENKFAPIAFVFRRAVYDVVGGYNEALPVLGDWYFNLEFLLHSDIRVLIEPLAYYHHRKSTSGGAYSNSVVGGISKHEEFNPVVRNSFLRKYSTQTSAALAVIMGAYMNETRTVSNRIFNEVSGLKTGLGSDASDTMADMADRAFVIAAFNGKIAARKTGGMLSRSRSIEPLEMDAEWDEILERFGQIGEPLPTPPSFSTDMYLEENEDVAKALRNKDFVSAFEHYVRHGRAEKRRRSKSSST